MDTLQPVLSVTTSVMKFVLEQARQASREKQDYTLKLENADGDDIFKYLLLINVASLESYVALTRV